MLFQRVLLTSRPVIPLYQSVPHPIGPDRFRQTTAFRDIIDLRLPTSCQQASLTLRQLRFLQRKPGEHGPRV
jgi:hypothetical protein